MALSQQFDGLIQMTLTNTPERSGYPNLTGLRRERQGLIQQRTGLGITAGRPIQVS